MNKIRLLALLLTGVMALSTLAACNSKEDPKETTTTEAKTEGTTAPETNDDPAAEAQEITVAATKGSAGLVGDLNAVFAPENGSENVVTGPAQNAVPYAIYAALPSPTVITAIKLTAPTENQNDMGGATIDGSVDGINWVTIKSTGTTITSGKTYNLNVSDETAYSYIRIRQSDKKRTEAFAFRNAIISGIPQAGAAGDLSVIVEEVDDSKLLTFSKDIIASAANFEGDAKDVFIDNNNSYKAQPSGSPNSLIVTMDKKTEIRKIVVKLWASNRQPRGTVIQGSLDGKNWTTLYTIEDLKKPDETIAESGEFTVQINDKNLYSFIRVRQNDGLADWAWTLNTILIYGVESAEEADVFPQKLLDAKTVNVSYHDSHVRQLYDDRHASIIWDLTDKTSIYTHDALGENAAPEKFWISGQFDAATVITQIVYYSPAQYANRVRTSYFEASVDGENWTKIVSLPANGDTFANSAIITLNVEDDTAYNYIRLVQGDGYHPYYWTLGTVEVKGVAETAAN